MQNDIYNAFLGFWSDIKNLQTGELIPVYHDMAVMAMYNLERPNPPEFPYITVEVVRPSFLGATFATASIWDRRNIPGFYGLINDVLRQAAAKIPVGGVIVPVGVGEADDKTGAMIFYRNEANFTSYLDEPNDPFVTRGIVRYAVKNYVV